MYFRGDSPEVAQVNTITVGGTPANLQVYTVTMNGKGVAYTASGVDTNVTIAAAIQALLAVSTGIAPEFPEATFTVLSAVVTATATEAGVPFVNTSGATGTGTLVTATTTASSGSRHWDTASNWSGNAVPVNGDSVYIRSSSVSILYGIDQNAVTLALLDIDSTYTGKIGNPDRNPLGYSEYRETYLKIGATVANVGRGPLTGPGRVRLNVGTAACTLNVYSTGTQDAAVIAAVDFVGTNAANVVNAYRGTVAVGMKPGTASTVLTGRVGSKDNPSSDAVVYFGDNVTLGTLSMSGGQVTVGNGFTTATLTDGTLTCQGAANFTTINANGGTVNYESSGTLGTYVGGTSSLIDFNRSPLPRAVTNCTLEANSGLRDPLKTVTFTNPISVRCKLSELAELDLGELFSIQRS